MGQIVTFGVFICIRLFTFALSIRQRAPHDLLILWY